MEKSTQREPTWLRARKEPRIAGRLEAEKDRYGHIVEAIALKKSELARADKNDAATEAQRRQLTGDLPCWRRRLKNSGLRRT